MKIAIIGSGYVGLVSATCFANVGNRVYCVDQNQERISQLKNGQVPIYEPGLEALIQSNVRKKNLSFHLQLAELDEAVELIFIAVGTPMGADRAADLSAVYDVARTIGAQMLTPLIIVNKSTVPVGTGDRIREIIAGELQQRGENIPFSIVSNPEFLKEGKAINDFSSPERIILGSDDHKALEVLTALYRPMVYRNPKERILRMSLRSAELAKYAANAMLATRISFINEIAELCESVGADINDVREGIGSDSRIGNKFLYPGVGYGGSCFPKDIGALRHTFTQYGLRADILAAVEERNTQQKSWIFTKILQHFSATTDLNKIKGKHFAIWGLSFKPNTDDVREAPSLVVIEQLLQAEASITAYCPKGREQAEFYLANKTCLNSEQLSHLRYADSPYEAANAADALLLLTEWREFLSPDWLQLKELLKTPLLFDGRTQFSVEYLAQLGFTYYAVGLKPKDPSHL